MPSAPQRAVAAGADSSKEPQTKQDKNLQKAIDAMRKDGVDERVAMKVLQAWKETGGIQSGKQLRNNVAKLGLSGVLLASVQLATDIVASYCASQTAFVVSLQTFWGHEAASFLLSTLSIYFGINAALDFFRLGTVIGSTVVLGTRAESLYQAIEELAGDQGSIGLVNKVEAAVSTSKVALALNSIRLALQDEAGEGGKIDMGTLDTLTSMFVLRNAEEKYGWTSEKAGITLDEASAAAQIFARFDSNEDYKLEMSEFKRLCDAADFQLTEAEVKKAVDMLDKRGSGTVEFDEFAEWYTSKCHSSGGNSSATSNGAATEKTKEKQAAAA